MNVGSEDVGCRWTSLEVGVEEPHTVGCRKVNLPLSSFSVPSLSGKPKTIGSSPSIVEFPCALSFERTGGPRSIKPGPRYLDFNRFMDLAFSFGELIKFHAQAIFLIPRRDAAYRVECIVLA